MAANTLSSVPDPSSRTRTKAEMIAALRKTSNCLAASNPESERWQETFQALIHWAQGDDLADCDPGTELYQHAIGLD